MVYETVNICSKLILLILKLKYLQFSVNLKNTLRVSTVDKSNNWKSDLINSLNTPFYHQFS